MSAPLSPRDFFRFLALILSAVVVPLIAADPDKKGEVAVAAGLAGLPPEKLSALEPSEVEIPFLGKIKTRKATKVFIFRCKDGSTSNLPLSIHYTEKGQFLRAEYRRPVAKEKIFPPDEVEYWMKSSGEKIVGIPAKQLTVTLEALFEKVHFVSQLGDADRIEVTYELQDSPNWKAKPVIVLSLVGVPMPFTSSRGDEIRRARYVFDEDGKLVFVDNAA